VPLSCQATGEGQQIGKERKERKEGEEGKER
jgi:hypothetical protein